MATIEELETEILGLKTELGVLVHYLSTVTTKDKQPILGPTRWEAYQADLKKALDKAGL